MRRKLRERDAERALTGLRFGEGGLWRRLEVACHITHLRSQILWVIALTWVPVVVFGLWTELTTGRTDPLMRDEAVHVRMLVATPILLVLDQVFPRVCSTTLGQLAQGRFIPENEWPHFERVWRSAGRWADAWLPELLIAVVSVGSGLAIVLGYIPLRGLPPGGPFTMAQRWYSMTDLPLFQFLLWRSLWRWLVWAHVLVGIARIRLTLVPWHPDRRGGISFLSDPSVGYCAMFLFAVSSVVCSEWGERFAMGETLRSFQPLLLLFAVVGSLVAFGPLFLFVPQLFRAKRLGLIEANSFATRFGRRFHRRWIRESSRSRGRELLAGDDIQGLDALGSSYRDGIAQLRLVLIDKTDVLLLLAATLAPVVPVMIARVPLEEWSRLLEMLTGGTLP